MKVDCQLCEDYGIKWPYKKGGCYDCDEDFNNFKSKEIRVLTPNGKVERVQ